MTLHTTNYFDTFMEVAEDCPVNVAEVPPQKEEKTIAELYYKIIHDHPYQHTSDDVLFTVYARRQGIAKEDYRAEREKFFSKGQPCMRSSALPKRYGWGVHSNEEGKLALVAVESVRGVGRRFFTGGDTLSLKLVGSREMGAGVTLLTYEHATER